MERKRRAAAGGPNKTGESLSVGTLGETTNEKELQNKIPAQKKEGQPSTSQKNDSGEEVEDDIDEDEEDEEDAGGEVHQHGSQGMLHHLNTTINVGSEYQALLPSLLHDDTRAKIPEYAVLIWRPPSTKELTEEQLDTYCTIATSDKCGGYNTEQALAMLMAFNYDVGNALNALNEHVPLSSGYFTLEDKITFEQAYSLCGKNFARIHSYMSHKRLKDLVEYYYSWKKSRRYTDFIDSTSHSEDSDQDESSDADEPGSGSHGRRDENRCAHCRKGSSHLVRVGDKGRICQLCNRHLRSTGTMRSFPKDSNDSDNKKTLKGICPEGFNYLTKEMFISFARKVTDNGQKVLAGDLYLEAVRRRINAMKSKVKNNLQELIDTENEVLRNGGGIDKYRIKSGTKVRSTHMWSEQDEMLAVQGFRKYGNDYEAIADVVGTKDKEQISEFYSAFRTKYGLDKLVDEFNDEFEAKKKELEAKKNEKDGEAEVIDLD